MNHVHMVLQGKGGIGKTFVSYLLAQYLLEQNLSVCCIDTDPVNASFSSFKALNVQAIELIADNSIQQSRFDDLIEQIVTQDKHFVVDNGAASFIPMSNYIIENDVVDVLTQANRKVIVHIVIAGGLGLINTISDFNQLAAQLPESAEIVVWLNEHFGKLEVEGKTFEEMKAYRNHKDRISGIIRLHRRTADTFGQDIGDMIEKRLTFEEALESDAFRLMSKQRLSMVRRELFEQLDAILETEKEAVAI